MQTIKIQRESIFKNLPEKSFTDQNKFYPYIQKNTRLNDYRKSRIVIIKKQSQQKTIHTELQKAPETTLLLREQKNYSRKYQTTARSKQKIFNLQLLKKNFVRLSKDNTSNFSKLLPSFELKNPVSSETQAETPKINRKVNLEKEQHSKQKLLMFRKTFCTSFNKPFQNRSLEMIIQQKRPPTTQVQTYRPSTRIRKVSSIGEETNSNFLAKYEIIKELGKGTYGTVYLARVIKKKQKSISFFNTNFFNSSKLITNQSEFDVSSENRMAKMNNFSEIVEHQGFMNLGMVESRQEPSTKKTQRKQQKITLQHIDENNSHISTSQNKGEDQKAQKSILGQKVQNGVQLNEDDELVAIKVYEKFKMNKDPAKFKNIRKQITIMQNLQHKGVIKLYESVQSVTKISLVVQFGGDLSLLDYLRKNFPLTQQKLKDFTRQLLDVLIYLHDKNIVHRDIKPQNILVKSDPIKDTLKLIDYGFSTLTNKSRKLNAICGTPNFMAPQLLSSKEYFGQKVDVWSFGVVVFVMAEGRHPFKSQDYQQLSRMAKKGKYVFKRKHQPEFESFIGQILKVNSEERPTAVQISKFKWLHEA